MTTTINNKHKKLNVPNLRFPEFQGEWEKCTLNEVCKFHNGRAYKQTELLAAGKYRVLRVGNFFTNDSWYYSNLELEDNKYAQNGDLLYAWSASFGPRFWREEKVIFHYHIWKIDSFKNVDKNFLYHFLDLDSAKIKNEVQGGTMVHITKGDMEKRTISYPSVPEQRNIARFLFLLDERIATQNKIIEDSKKLKSAISHILFSSKCAIHLSDIANVVMGQSPSSNAYNDQGIGMPLVQGNLDISNGKTTPRLYTAEFNQTTEEGNIILTVRAPVGEVAKATKKVCLGRGVCAIIPHEENMSDFIYQYLTFYKFMWRKYEQGSTFTSINGSDVRNIPCPKVRNVSILTLLDRKINIEERVIKLYQSQKQYMLCQMFI